MRVILPESILVPTDFSGPADEALDYALALAEKVGARVTLLHVYGIPVVGITDGAIVAADLAGRIAMGAQQALEEAVSKYQGRRVVLKALLKTGDPRNVIHSVAQDVDADLIVMGTHGRRGIARALLGSVTEQVVRTATRPVLTVRGTRSEPNAALAS